jgi:hypothetical protein
MANVITAQTPIRITIATPGRNGNISGDIVSRVVMASVLGFPKEGLEAPVFPQQEVASINGNEKLTAADKQSRVNAIILEYTEAQNAFLHSGGVNALDMVPSAVVDYLVAHEGFSANGRDEKPYVRATDLVANFVEDGTAVQVYPSATWG